MEPDIAGLDFYFDAFNELSTTRSIGMAAGPIPFTAIAEYSRIYELSDFEDFAYIIRRMDYVYLQMNSPEPSEKPKGEGKNASVNSSKKNPNQNRHRRITGTPKTG